MCQSWTWVTFLKPTQIFLRPTHSTYYVTQRNPSSTLENYKSYLIKVLVERKVDIYLTLFLKRDLNVEIITHMATHVQLWYVCLSL